MEASNVDGPYAIADFAALIIFVGVAIGAIVYGAKTIVDEIADTYEVRDADADNDNGKPPKTPEPKVPYPGDDPAKPPGDGWEWRGQDGSQPGDPNGNWYNPTTGESLNPDLGHPLPEGPHWDYKPFRGSEWYRWFPNGDILPKN